jgi:hypothetical protein
MGVQGDTYRCLLKQDARGGEIKLVHGRLVLVEFHLKPFRFLLLLSETFQFGGSGDAVKVRSGE